MKSRQGSHAGYNAPSAVDDKNGLIVSADVVDDGNYIKQFASQIKKAQENTEKQCEQAESQKIYKRRKMKVERPFGHIKHNLGLKNFLLRGIDGARA